MLQAQSEVPEIPGESHSAHSQAHFEGGDVIGLDPLEDGVTPASHVPPDVSAGPFRGNAEAAALGSAAWHLRGDSEATGEGDADVRDPGAFRAPLANPLGLPGVPVQQILGYGLGEG